MNVSGTVAAIADAEAAHDTEREYGMGRMLLMLSSSLSERMNIRHG